MEADQNVQVVIVGAGLSGLRAAVEIHKAGLSYVVLEAMDRVGGKTLSMPTSSDGTAPVDLGAAWINDTNQSEMYALAQEFGFDLIKQRAEGNDIHQDGEGTISVIPYGAPGPLTPEQAEEFGRIFIKLEELINRSDLEDPSQGPDAKELDALTALEFVDKTFGSEFSKIMTHVLSRALLGVDADEISALYLVDYLKSGTGLANIISDLKDGGQYLRNRQGNQTFSKRLAAQLHPGSVKLSTPVTSICQNRQGCTVTTDDGKKFQAEKVIVSVPTALYKLLKFDPPLPAAKQELSESTKLGYYAKTILVFSTPWWQDAGLSGIFTSDNGPISFTRDTCSPEDEQYSITCFHTGQPGRDWSKLPAQERQDAVLAQFRAAFHVAVEEIPAPIKIIEKEWVKDPWAQGAPTPVMGPGLMTSDAGKSIREPFGSIHFVGTETSLVWKGYMEGAVRSGVRGATEVLEGLKTTSLPN